MDALSWRPDKSGLPYESWFGSQVQTIIVPADWWINNKQKGGSGGVLHRPQINAKLKESWATGSSRCQGVVTLKDSNGRGLQIINKTRKHRPSILHPPISPYRDQPLRRLRHKNLLKVLHLLNVRLRLQRLQTNLEVDHPFPQLLNQHRRLLHQMAGCRIRRQNRRNQVW